jgi:hypothetical protein
MPSSLAVSMRREITMLGLLLAACMRADSRDRPEDRDHSSAARLMVRPTREPGLLARYGLDDMPEHLVALSCREHAPAMAIKRGPGE